ncbi:MAG: tetratricopeptide repeat protein, partial [Actinobacteria bacterium]|nr:tetratricopeptide repeat protein [Actinomycetota bacterium]
AALIGIVKWGGNLGAAVHDALAQWQGQQKMIRLQYRGTGIAVTGTGFTPNNQVHISYSYETEHGFIANDSDNLLVASTNGDGAFGAVTFELTSDPVSAINVRAADVATRQHAETSIVLTDQQRILGPDQANTFANRRDLASAYLEAGRLDDALPRLEGVLADQERDLGPDHPLVAAALYQLGFLRAQLGDLSAAEGNLARAATIDRTAFGPDHPEVAADLEALAAVHEKQGDRQAATANLRSAIRILQRILDPDDPVLTSLRTRLRALEATDVSGPMTGL